VVGSLFGTFGLGGIVTTFIEGRKRVQSEDKQEPEQKQQSKSAKRRQRP
jgi:hypothetical protein